MRFVYRRTLTAHNGPEPCRPDGAWNDAGQHVPNESARPLATSASLISGAAYPLQHGVDVGASG